MSDKLNAAQQARMVCDEWEKYRRDNYAIETTGLERNAFLVAYEEAIKRTSVVSEKQAHPCCRDYEGHAQTCKPYYRNRGTW